MLKCFAWTLQHVHVDDWRYKPIGYWATHASANNHVQQRHRSHTKCTQSDQVHRLALKQYRAESPFWTVATLQQWPSSVDNYSTYYNASIQYEHYDTTSARSFGSSLRDESPHNLPKPIQVLRWRAVHKYFLVLDKAFDHSSEGTHIVSWTHNHHESSVEPDVVGRDGCDDRLFLVGTAMDHIICTFGIFNVRLRDCASPTSCIVRCASWQHVHTMTWWPANKLQNP